MVQSPTDIEVGDAWLKLVNFGSSILQLTACITPTLVHLVFCHVNNTRSQIQNTQRGLLQIINLGPTFLACHPMKWLHTGYTELDVEEWPYNKTDLWDSIFCLEAQQLLVMSRHRRS